MRHRYRRLVTGLGLVALAVALVLLAPWGQDPVAANGTIHYVDADATTGGNNGSSWADAFIELQSALDAALSGDQIWVAEGTYTPIQEYPPGGPRSVAFQLINGVALYGGFDPGAGDDTWEERDWVANPTILSGDLDGDDGPDFANNDENSYNVFYHPNGTSPGLDSTAILDGFTITGGNANGDSMPYGGGMYNDSSSPTVNNCIFSHNSARGYGGGMYNYSSSPALTNCTFDGNSAYYSGGGGMHNGWSSSPTLTNCTFSDNSAIYASGGGMHNSYASPVLTNCTFDGNSAYYSGGGMWNVHSSPALTNCTFSGNSSVENGGGMSNYGSSPTLTNCVLWGDTPQEIYNSDETSLPVVTYSDVQGGYEGEGNIDTYPFFVDAANGDFHLGACSRCIDAGNNDAPDLPDYDFEGDDRILDGDDDGTATVDMGVDEVVDGLPCMQVYLPVVLRGY